MVRDCRIVGSADGAARIARRVVHARHKSPSTATAALTSIQPRDSRRQFDQLVAHTQAVIRSSGRKRTEVLVARRFFVHRKMEDHD